MRPGCVDRVDVVVRRKLLVAGWRALTGELRRIRQLNESDERRLREGRYLGTAVGTRKFDARVLIDGRDCRRLRLAWIVGPHAAGGAEGRGADAPSLQAHPRKDRSGHVGQIDGAG